MSDTLPLNENGNSSSRSVSKLIHNQVPNISLNLETDGISRTDSGSDQEQELDVNYSPVVVAAIQEILPSDDPFDAADFSAVDYINARFPVEQSLQLLDDALEEMRGKLSDVDDQTQRLVRQLADDSQTGHESLLCAEEAIHQLSARFQDIKVASGESEQRVKAITRDIRQLDTGKRNLTASITALNHLQMLAEGVEKLHRLSAAREYGELAPLLQGVLQVLQHLQRYTHIPQVKQLAQQVHDTRQELEKQILAEFKSASASLASQQLTDACLVADVLDARVRCRIIDKVLEQQLAEYKAVFAGSERDGWLSCVDLRRKWFLRAAVEFDRTLAHMFPHSWKVPARFAYAFCQLSHQQLTQAIQLRPAELDSSSLLQAHRLLSDLEALIVQKYGTSFTFKDLEEGTPGVKGAATASQSPITLISPASVSQLKQPPLASLQEDENSNSSSPFTGAITGCFLPHLHVYLDTVDKRLGEQLDRFAQTMRDYRFERLEEEESNVMPCCGELFTLYKNILVEYLKVSGGGYGLPALTAVFQKRLREFATRVLRGALPQQQQTIIPKDIKDISAIINQVQSLLREGEGVRLSCEEEVMRVCSVLVSAEYCSQMTAKLQAKLVQKWQKTTPTSSQRRMSTSVDMYLPDNATTAADVKSASTVSPELSLSSEEELFHAVLSQCVLLLVGHVESLVEPCLASLPRLNWMLEQTGDQSPYVSQMAQHLASTVPMVRYHLHTARKYFTRFCDKLAASVCTKFSQQVYKCRPINSVGCEQLLLDCHALKAALLHMPVVAAQVVREPPPSYIRMVTRALSRPELVLQVVMGEYSAPAQLVDKSLRLMPDLSLQDFQKVLEMRGIKERSALLEVFRQRSNGGGGTGDQQQPQPPTSNTAASPQHELSKIAKLEKMLKARRLI